MRVTEGTYVNHRQKCIVLVVTGFNSRVMVVYVYRSALTVGVHLCRGGQAWAAPQAAACQQLRLARHQWCASAAFLSSALALSIVCRKVYNVAMGITCTSPCHVLTRVSSGCRAWQDLSQALAALALA